MSQFIKLLISYSINMTAFNGFVRSANTLIFSIDIPLDVFTMNHYFIPILIQDMDFRMLSTISITLTHTALFI